MPNQSEEYAKGMVLIVAAIILILLAVGTKLDVADLATSPLTRNMAQVGQISNKSPEKHVSAPGQAGVTVQVQNAATTTELKPAVAAKVPARPSTAPETERADMVIIPKIGVSAPIVTPETTDAVKLKKLLDLGAVIYPDSVGLGKDGQTILLGHSAPAGWPKIKHDTIFSDIVNLAAGDKVMAIYNDRTYNYTVLKSQIIPKGGDIPTISTSGSSLVLVTCWPPGRDLKRLVVETQLESIE